WTVPAASTPPGPTTPGWSTRSDPGPGGRHGLRRHRRPAMVGPPGVASASTQVSTPGGIVARGLRSVPRRLLPSRRHPARIVVTAFGYVVAAGTALLMLPVATESGESSDFVTALFTATTSVCVTGLVVTDTAGHWSTFGELVILALVQIG